MENCKKSIAVFGDIHGHLETVEAALAVDADEIIFVGDFLDSFTRSQEDQMECLNLVLSATNATALLGNHEASYLYDQRCSGYNQTMANIVNAYGRTRLASTLLDHVWLEYEHYYPIVITHAGVTADWFDIEPRRITEHDVRNWLYSAPVEDRYGVGYARGGNMPVGGHLWCDWWREFEPIPAVRQIVGHSNYRPHGAYGGIVSKGDNYNIDCLGRINEYMFIKDDGLMEVRSLDLEQEMIRLRLGLNDQGESDE